MNGLLAALGPLLSRLLLSAVFLHGGVTKLTAPHRAAAAITGHGLPLATAGAYAAAGLELVLGLLIVIGLKTRAAALVAAGWVLLVTWLFHWHPALHGDYGQLLHLLKNAGIVGGLLLLSGAGPGPASLDRS